MSVCVILNPHSGRNAASRRFAKFRDAYGREVTLYPTTSPSHARELARDAAEDGFRVVAAAGGDGTVHEVANGLLACERANVTLAIVPVGSANDYAHSIRKQFGVANLDDDRGNRVDVGLLRCASGEERFFVESIGMGLSARVTLQSRAVNRRGLVRYAVAAYRAIRDDLTVPELQLRWDQEPPVLSPTLMLSLLLGRREGNFPLAPNAVLDDGLFDYLLAGQFTSWQAIRMIPRLAIWGPPANHPRISQGRCRSLHVVSPEPLVVHSDGEIVCTPEHDCRELEIRLLPKRLRVKVC